MYIINANKIAKSRRYIKIVSHFSIMDEVFIRFLLLFSICIWGELSGECIFHSWKVQVKYGIGITLPNHFLAFQGITRHDQCNICLFAFLFSPVMNCRLAYFLGGWTASLPFFFSDEPPAYLFPLCWTAGLSIHRKTRQPNVLYLSTSFANVVLISKGNR